MNNIKDISFIDYIKNQGIRLCENSPFVDKKNISVEKIIDQIGAAAELHSIARNYDGFDVKTIKNRTGKLIGRYKIQVKNLKKYAVMKEKSDSLNMFEEYFLDTYKDVIKRCEACFNYIDDDEYLEIIKRSMKNNDICLGNCYFDNMWKKGNIFIVDYSDLSFNMVETDGVKFIKKLKANDPKLNVLKIIDEYINAENISEFSRRFMKALISYPDEYMKCIERYKRSGTEELEERFVKRLAKAIKKDGESII